jgi:uncharacterized protein
MKPTEAKAKADSNSIQVLLIIWDNYWRHLWEKKRILAIDPGFRSGCKIVCLDEKEICCTTRPFIHTPQKRGDGDEENPFYGQFI